MRPNIHAREASWQAVPGASGGDLAEGAWVVEHEQSVDMSEVLTAASSQQYDALIVGSGTAGLLAAHELLRQRLRSRIVVVDAGDDLSERRRHTANQMVGYGGAGLYLGGRLYLGPATIPVQPPTSAPPALRPVLGRDAYAQRAAEVDALFSRLGATAEVRPAPEGALARSVALAQSAGLEYVTSYPARLLGAPERSEVLDRLLSLLKQSGVRFAFGTRVGSLDKVPGGFAASVYPSSPQVEGAAEQIHARALLLAPGRLAAEWLVRVVRGLGARVEPLPTAFGVRLEVQASAYAALTDVNPDPRLQLPLPADAVIKTYATCPGGEVTAVRRYGTLVASGIPLPPTARHPTTTFAALVQPGIQGAEHQWRGADEIAHAANERSPGALIVQRIDDARHARPTLAEALAANALQPTWRQAVAGALHDLYPVSYWHALDELMARINRIAPGTDVGDALLYGPAEERFWVFPTDELLQTDVAGLFVAGDGPGQTQGVIQAGVAGTLAGSGLARFLQRVQASST
jgi:uncharacterized FAD-dependent dehydrogenase